MINKPIYLHRDRKSQCNSHVFHNKSLNCVTFWQRCGVLGSISLSCCFFFHNLFFFSLLNAPAPWRNSCPYIPSTAKSHWSQCEQTIVKRWNKNEEEKKRACSLSGHSRDRRRRTELWPGTPSLPPKFWFIWLTLCEKHLQLHIKNTRPFCSSTFRLHYYSAEPSPRPCGVRRKGYFARPICSVLNRIIM